MKAFIRLLIMLELVIMLVPLAAAKTHKDNYPVACDILWRAVRDTIRNSGKYGIIAIDNNEMTASFNIGGGLGGKRINSVVLNKLTDTTCEMQIQTAFSGLMNNDYGDFKKRLDDTLAKLPKNAGPQTAQDSKSAEPGKAAPEFAAGNKNIQFPSGLKAGQSPEEVKKALGNPIDSIEMKDSLVYIYPTCKLIFEKGALTEVRYPEPPSQ